MHGETDAALQPGRNKGLCRGTRGIGIYIDNGHAMGLIVQDMIEVVCSMTIANFYKSMTTYHDHTAWHDVYHAITPVGSIAYIKVSDPSGRRPVIQFKEK